MSGSTTTAWATAIISIPPCSAASRWKKPRHDAWREIGRRRRDVHPHYRTFRHHPRGKNWGIEVKTEFSGNTVAQKNDLRQFLGRDYRTLSPIGATADGVSGMPDVLTGYTGKPSPTALLLDEA